MKILYFDTETTGKLEFKLPTSHPAQPNLVQLGALLHDSNRKVRGAINLIVKPNGWEIPTEASNIHGITTEDALKYGVPLVEALEIFNQLVGLADLVVAHNMAFDEAVMGTQYFRQAMESPLLNKRLFCTMKASTYICKIPGPYGFKWPKLEEAHRHFTGESFEGAHDAMADVLACARVFYHLPRPEVPANE